LAQIRQVVSESLQATIRRLLPSQQGFTEDLQASNVITPIIDLTPTAEGSAVREDLQLALSHGSQTAFLVTNTNSTIVSTAGFYRIVGVSSCLGAGGATQQVDFFLNDGLGNKRMWGHSTTGVSGSSLASVPFDLTFFLNSGHSMIIDASANARVSGSVRQIADINGDLVNPDGFAPQ